MGLLRYQTETDYHPLSVWWAPEWTIPYPSEPVAKETAHVYLANYTHVFSATTTNEFVFSYCGIRQRRQLSPIPRHRAATGLASRLQSLFGYTKTDQIPNSTGGWNSGLTEINEFDFNSGIYGANTFGKTSKAPAISDTFTKIVKHSLAEGRLLLGYEENLQASGSDINGNYDLETWGAPSTYNLTLDRLMVASANYDQYQHGRGARYHWHQWSIWAQDSWKATRKLTVNFGLRADHDRTVV